MQCRPTGGSQLAGIKVRATHSSTTVPSVEHDSMARGQTQNPAGKTVLKQVGRKLRHATIGKQRHGASEKRYGRKRWHLQAFDYFVEDRGKLGAVEWFIILGDVCHPIGEDG